MSTETARLVIACVAAVGAVVWLAAFLTFLRSSTQASAAVRTVSVPGMTPEDARKELLRAIVAAQFYVAEESPGTVVAETLAQPKARVIFRLEPAGNGTGITAVVDASRVARAMRALAALFLILGLAAVTVLPYMLWTHVAPSGDPAVRTQAVQTVQLVHFLWPPFLFLYLAKRMRAYGVAAASNMLTMLEVGT